MARDARADRNTEIALTLLRVVVGVVFFMHGYQKWFTMGIPGVTGFFTHVGAPFPGISAYVMATAELVGGIALILGLFTRIVAIPLMLDLAGAIVLVHAKNGFFVPMGIEFVMTLLTATIVLALAGGGTASIDRMLGRS
jgi:Predicted membrane protein